MGRGRGRGLGACGLTEGFTGSLGVGTGPPQLVTLTEYRDDSPSVSHFGHVALRLLTLVSIRHQETTACCHFGTTKLYSIVHRPSSIGLLSVGPPSMMFSI